MATLGGRNRWTQEYFADRPRNGCDSDDLMYCANSPLRVPGELGYLVYFPWKTVRLFDATGHTNYHRVLDTFTTTNAVSAKGLVNPNSEIPGAIASVFNEMPIDLFPGDPTATPVSTNIALLISVAVTNYTWFPGHFFNRVSDMGNLSDIFNDPLLLGSLGARTEFEKEALLRNSSCLFNPRQVLFTALLASDIVRSGENAEYLPGNPKMDAGVPIVAERRAVCLFWFDAYTGSSFARLFRYVDY
jgi:hypothetical protein